MPDMLVKLYELPEFHDELKKAEADGIVIRRPLAPEMHKVAGWVREHFNEGWASEVTGTFSNTPVSCFIAVKDKQMLGFSCYDTTVRDFFGPMGVDESLRGKGIGKLLLLKALQAMRDEGYGYAIIGGAGPTEFYTKTSGATIIEGSVPGMYKGMIY